MIKGALFRLNKIKDSLFDQLFGKEDYSKFVVITRSRSGSNLLISLLDSHKSIIAHGERFRRLGDDSCKTIYNDIFPKKSARTIGFKLFYKHPFGSDDRSIWDFLKTDKTIKVIHLSRKNLLRVHVSLLIAEKTDQWRTYNEKSISLADKRVHVDIEKLLLDLKQTNDFIKETRKTFSDHKLIEVSYDDLVQDQEKTLKSILNFLDLPPTTVESHMKRQNPENIEELVLNYPEIVEALKNTEYSFMLK